MESEDYTFYQSLTFILENNVDDIGSELYFSTEVSCGYLSANVASLTRALDSGGRSHVPCVSAM